MTAHHRHPHDHADVDVQIEAILELLRTDGGRITVGRRAIVRALLTGPDHHVTAEDLVALVQLDHPDVHLSTVYRTLETLELLHVVDRVDLGVGSAVFHLTDHVHHHLVCTTCGSVTEIDATDLANLAKQLQRDHAFEMQAPVVINGTCHHCQA